MAVKTKEKRRVGAFSPQEAEKSVGYGYSSIISQLLTSLDQPVRNTDQFRHFYKQMIEEDETIGTGLEYLAGRIVSKIGEFSHADERIKDLVDRCIESVRGTMTEIRKEILRSSFAFGYGVAEFTIRNEKGLWLLSSMPVYDPTSLSFKMAKFPDNSYGIGAVMQRSGTGQDIEIPARKCLIKTHGNGNTPYGQPLLRRCYRWWAFKRAVPKLWAVALERYGMPLLHGTADSEKAGEKLSEALANINSKAYIVTGEKSKVEAVSSVGGDISSGYMLADELCDKKIYRAMFLPSLLGSGENGGSYSLGQVHLELFNATAVALAEEYIDCELEQLWRPLIEWNFGPQEDYGEFAVTDSISAEEKKTLSEMLLNLANAGVIDPDSDREWMREALGLPEPEEGAVFPKWELERMQRQREQEPS